MPDHVHLLVTRDPLFGIHRLAEQIKRPSGR
jgi:REP element-mobilizing transposase RayT